MPTTDVNELPKILERKLTLAGEEKTFSCRVLQRSADELVVLFVSDRAYRVADLELPPGTVTIAHYWLRRPYNVYHWISPAGVTLAHYFNLADGTLFAPETFTWRDLTLDVLFRPGHAPEVLDEDELPSGLDDVTRSQIRAALDQVQADAPALLPQLEATAERHWRQLFGVPRDGISSSPQEPA